MKLSDTGYPDICQKWCAKFGTMDCPTSVDCMARLDKPHFKPKHTEQSILSRIHRRILIRRICRINRYNCAECIYHKHVFRGAEYAGTICRLETRKDKQK